MHPSTRKIADHMKDFGLCLLGRAIVNATYSEYGFPYAHAMAVVHCVHASEIIVKARIAEEHPLLIFSKLPKLNSQSDQLLSIEDLFSSGRTVAYEELPDVLWAATGYRIKEVDRFREFGRLRNAVIHLGVPEEDLSSSVLRFSFEVMQPVISEFWGESVITWVHEYDPDILPYLREALQNLSLDGVCPPDPDEEAL